MRKKVTFDAVICHEETGKEYRHEIIADNAEAAKSRAITNARRTLELTMAEREYGTFNVVSLIERK